MSRKHCSNIYTYINAVALTSITKRRQFADHNKLLFPQSAYVTRIRTKQFQKKFSKTKYVLVKFVISEITFYGVTYIRCGKYSATFFYNLPLGTFISDIWIKRIMIANVVEKC